MFFIKYSYAQRLIIVSRVKQGEAIAHLSKEYHINETQILAWVRMWDNMAVPDETTTTLPSYG
ncbi:helix-turn-helix domain-containing protein [Bacteroides bouchesdurhonensis]